MAPGSGSGSPPPSPSFYLNDSLTDPHHQQNKLRTKTIEEKISEIYVNRRLNIHKFTNLLHMAVRTIMTVTVAPNFGYSRS